MAEKKITEHFQVPEGYFDNLTEQVMMSLPEQKFQPMHVDTAEPVKTVRKGRIMPMWTRYAAAACVSCVVMVSAFTALYSDGDKQGQQSPVAAVPTTIADSAGRASESIVPAETTGRLVLAKADGKSVRKSIATAGKAASPAPASDDVEPVTHASSDGQVYDANVNTGYDQNDMERAAMYMNIDHQDMCEMMYEDM